MDPKVDDSCALLHHLYGVKMTRDDRDKLFWLDGCNQQVKVRPLYKLLHGSSSKPGPFPAKVVWGSLVPPSVSFFVWTTIWERILIIDNLIIIGRRILNQCYLCGAAEEIIDHLLLQ